MLQNKELLGAIKEKLRILVDIFEGWGLGTDDFLVVGELAFNLAGIPAVASHIEEFLQGAALPVEVYVDPAKYQGPRVPAEIVQHPFKIKVPVDEAYHISKEHGLNIEHLLIADAKAFAAPTQIVDLGEGKVCQIMKPAANLSFFAERTILRYLRDFAGEDKIREWFDKLHRIKYAAEKVGRTDLVQACEGYIKQSEERWGPLLKGG